MADEQATVETGKAISTEKAPTMPPALVRRGIDESMWRALMNIFPGCASDSVLLMWDYCKARKLDPMKKPCHIVPMKVKVNGEYVWRDVVMPGIYEYRITAHRTGKYLGHSKPEYGPQITFAGVQAPEWCDITVYRQGNVKGERIEFPVRVYFVEVAATKDEWENKVKTGNKMVNERWSRAPIQMLVKCCEAAALREAFPEEFGGEATAEEMDGRGGEVIDAQAHVVQVDPLADYLENNDPSGEIEKLLANAKLTKGQVAALLKKYATNPSGLVQELKTAVVETIIASGDKVAAQRIVNAESSKQAEKIVEPVKTSPFGRSINTPAEAKAEVAKAEVVKAEPVEPPAMKAIFDKERDSI